MKTIVDITGDGLAKAVTEYWMTRTSQSDAEISVSCINQALIEKHTKGKMRITASTAIRWLKKLGFQWK